MLAFGRRVLAALVFSALTLSLISCAKSPEQSSGQLAYYTFTDDAGRRVSLRKKPEKVAVLFSSYAEIWQLAGGEVAVTVGESIERGIASEGTPLVDAGAGKSIDAELLLSYAPDFVLCSADLSGQMEAAAVLEDAGVPASAFHVESFEDYLRMLKICTDILEQPSAYETYGLQVRAEIGRVLEEAQAQKASQGGKKILFIRAGSSYNATKAKTPENNFVCQMLSELGAQNIAEQADILLEELSLEEILLQNPDYIFISTMGSEGAAKEYMQSLFAAPGWQELDAVRNGAYAFLPKELFHFKPNARWAEAYAYLAELLYFGQ